MVLLRAVFSVIFVLVLAVACKDDPASTAGDSEVDAAVPATADTAATQTCAGVTCWDPPETICSAEGGGLMTVYAPSGYCVNGSCSYLSLEALCPSGVCQDGSCQERWKRP